MTAVSAIWKWSNCGTIGLGLTQCKQFYVASYSQINKGREKRLRQTLTRLCCGVTQDLNESLFVYSWSESVASTSVSTDYIYVILIVEHKKEARASALQKPVMKSYIFDLVNDLNVRSVHGQRQRPSDKMYDWNHIGNKHPITANVSQPTHSTRIYGRQHQLLSKHRQF